MSVPSPENVYIMQWPVDHATTLAVACVHFAPAPAPIDAGGFRLAGIDCPPQIAGSVPKRRAEFFHGRLCARGDPPAGPRRAPDRYRPHA
ncbi:MAG TPA: hypothetical protein VN089_26320 [Duganella sp.]|nr:hypothetical protein [Duganella sp.]